jgi:thiosulfate dehydrogenase (quinone) large subunit
MKIGNYKKRQIFALTALRVLIGWHLLYEGLVKVIDPAWTAAPFLANSQGPFAQLFKSMAANPALLGITDQLNQWGLVLIGLSLILGLWSRWASAFGMILLFIYYVANPPFIGIEPSMAEGSYLIVNKNLIEVFALLVLALFPTERIIGIERLFHDNVHAEGVALAKSV